MKYRKKPVVVEAIQYKPSKDYDNINDLIEYMSDIIKFTNHSIKVGQGIGFDNITIQTLEGEMLVSEGDYIIKGVNGEFYPCKPDIFHKTYEKVEE